MGDYAAAELAYRALLPLVADDPEGQAPIVERLASSVYKQSRLASRTPEEIEMVFDRNRGAIYALYQRALGSAPTLQGKLVLRLTIAPSGEVTDFGIVSSELDDPELELVARVKLFRFEAKEVEAITTTKPNRLLPRLKLMIVVQYCVGGRREKRFRDGRFRRGAVT